MKLTPELKTFLGKECYRYSAKLKIKTPLLIYTQKDLESNINATPQEIQYFMIHDLGRSWKEHNTVYLNIDNTDFLWQIIDTLVHE